jgi:hypothetical protein
MSVNVIYTAGAIAAGGRDSNAGTTDGRFEVKARPAMPFVDHGINDVAPVRAACVFTKLYTADKPRKFSSVTFAPWATECEGEPMSTPDP